MNKIEFLHFTINRHDYYIESAQSKSNLYLGLNTAIIAGLISLISMVTVQDLHWSLIIIMILLGLCSTISAIISLCAVKPDLSNSGKKNLLFFKDINSLTKKNYKKKINKLNNKKSISNFCNQSKSLSSILTRKYKVLSFVSWLVMLQFILLLLWLILFIILNT